MKQFVNFVNIFTVITFGIIAVSMLVAFILAIKDKSPVVAYIFFIVFITSLLITICIIYNLYLQ